MLRLSRAWTSTKVHVKNYHVKGDDVVHTQDPLLYTNDSLEDILQLKEGGCWSSRIDRKKFDAENCETSANLPVITFDKKGNVKLEATKDNSNSRTKLHVMITVFDISAVDAIDESFEIYFKMVLLYITPKIVKPTDSDKNKGTSPINAETSPSKENPQKSASWNESYPINTVTSASKESWKSASVKDNHPMNTETSTSRDEIAASDDESYPMDMNTLLSKINLPSVLVFNELESLETNDDEELTIHTYGNDHYLVQWSKSSRMKCRERMELKDFPFDLQRLTLDLRLDAPDASKKYDMGISVVQFHQQAIELTEWEMYPPSIRRHGTDRSEVKIKARRHHMYYLQNIAGTMFMLSLLGLLTFQMDVGDIGSRVGTVLTLILTAVAFKFILSESLPKVPYNTMMDYYIMFAMLSLAATSVICICPAYIPEERVNYRSKINKYLCICAGAVIVLTSVAWIIWAEVRFRITLYDDEEHEQYGSASWSIVNPIKRIIFIINEARRHQDKSASCSVLKPIKRVRPKQDSSNKPGSGDNESKATKGDNWYSYIFSSDKLSIRRPTENNQS